MSHNLVLAIFIMVISSVNFSTAQKIATLDDGTKVILNNNGTWEKYTEKEQAKKDAQSPIPFKVKCKIEKDALDGKVTYKTETWRNFAFSKVNSSKASAYVSMRDEYYFFVFAFKNHGLGCLSEYDGEISIKLSNGEVLEMAQVSDTKCDDSSATAMYTLLTRDEMTQTISDADIKKLFKSRIDKLLENAWELIRVQGSEYYSDYYPVKSNKMKNSENYFQGHIQSILDLVKD